jgi:uncharacterized protein (UPF0548 family)
MFHPEKAGSVWFGRGRLDDPQYLDLWRGVPLTYSAGQDLDDNWNVDHYEVILGSDKTGALFQRAAQLTLNNQFYPAEVMVTSSDYGRENRQVQPGDRVLQRIRLFEIARKPVLEALTLNEITEVIREERRAGFTYTTTAAHSEIGEWSPVVEWRDNGDVVLVIGVASRARPGASLLSRSFTRRMQLRAHRLSIANFTRLLGAGPRAVQNTRFSAELLPAGLLATAFLFVVAAAFAITRKSRS